MGLNKKEHDLYYPFLVNQDGEYCLRCGKTPTVEYSDSFFCQRLVIHETEYIRPLDVKKLCLLCDSCNQKFHPEKQEKFSRELTPEMQVNRAKEPSCREYMINRVIYDGGVEIHQLIASTAEKYQASIKAVTGYLDKLTSDEGKLAEVFNGTYTKIYLKSKAPKFEFDIMTNSWLEIKS